MIKFPDFPTEPAESDDSGCEEDAGMEFDTAAYDLESAEVTYEVAVENLTRQIVEDTKSFFSPGGVLQSGAEASGRKWEFRPQQLAMAEAIGNAMLSGRNLAVEAPTGVGKSFAYLAPLVFRAKNSDFPALVSTETINLQEQLIEKDIPLLKKLTGIDFKACLAKGRGNYLCRRRFALLSGAQQEQMLPAPSLALDIERLKRWAETTDCGERDDMNFRMASEVWPLVCSESGSCPGPKCNFFRSCFYFRARREWENADILVANHALFFTDLGMRAEGGGGTLLPNYGLVVIDEAHTLEDNAAEHLGLHVSRSGIAGMLNRLFNPDAARGLLMRSGADTLALRQVVAGLKDDATKFFRPFEQYIHDAPEWRAGAENGARRVLEPGKFPDTLTAQLMVLYRLLQPFTEDQEDESLQAELTAQLDRCRGYIDGIKAFINMELTDAVYYVELDRGSVVLNAAPLNVADLLYELLFDKDFVTVLSSATLTVRGSFDFFLSRVGFANGDTLLLDSPYRRDQAQVIVDRSMPSVQSAEYNDGLIARIPYYIEKTSGKAFVLFTSYSSMRYCAEKLRPYFAERGIVMLEQNGEMTRSAMLKAFKADVDSVLFGTDSFWTGVDVPGEALSNVIIVKLPFPSPGMPIVEARCERIEASGRSSFRDYSLPAAVLKFRQGAGRLIRSAEDSGIIVILDSRVVSKGYGRNFLESLPYPVVFE